MINAAQTLLRIAILCLVQAVFFEGLSVLAMSRLFHEVAHSAAVAAVMTSGAALVVRLLASASREDQ